jgi:hypothetical protein
VEQDEEKFQDAVLAGEGYVTKILVAQAKETLYAEQGSGVPQLSDIDIECRQSNRPITTNSTYNLGSSH